MCNNQMSVHDREKRIVIELILHVPYFTNKNMCKCKLKPKLMSTNVNTIIIYVATTIISSKKFDL